MIKITMPLKDNESIIDIIKDGFNNNEIISITIKGKKYNATPIAITSRCNEKGEIIFDCEFNDYLIKSQNNDR